MLPFICAGIYTVGWCYYQHPYFQYLKILPILFLDTNKKYTAIGIGFSLLGDILLMFDYFMAGVIAFFFAHNCFIREISSEPDPDAILMATVPPLLFINIINPPSELFLLLFGYAWIITLSLVLAFRNGKMRIGISLFVLSDLILSIDMFILNHGFSCYTILIYWLSLYLISIGK